MRSRLTLLRREAHGIFSLRLYNQTGCRSVMAKAQGSGAWLPAEIGADDRGMVDVSVRAAWCLPRSKAPTIYHEFERKVFRLVAPAVRQIWGSSFDACDGTQLVRYGTGGHFLPHTDGDEYGYPDRYFTVLCYLNKSFQGGNTSFESLNYRARPEPGKALVFPVRFRHCAEPVFSGEKLVFVTWLCAPPPFRWF